MSLIKKIKERFFLLDSKVWKVDQLKFMFLFVSYYLCDDSAFFPRDKTVVKPLCEGWMTTVKEKLLPVFEQAAWMLKIYRLRRNLDEKGIWPRTESHTDKRQVVISQIKFHKIRMPLRLQDIWSVCRKYSSVFLLIKCLDRCIIFE